MLLTWTIFQDQNPCKKVMARKEEKEEAFISNPDELRSNQRSRGQNLAMKIYNAFVMKNWKASKTILC